MQLTIILSLLFAVIIAIFAGLNSSVVVVNFLFTKVEMSQAIVILISAVFGAVLVYLINIVKAFKRKREIKTLSSENSKYEKQIIELNEKINELKEEKEALVESTNASIDNNTEQQE